MAESSSESSKTFKPNEHPTQNTGYYMNSCSNCSNCNSNRSSTPNCNNNNNNNNNNTMTSSSSAPSLISPIKLNSLNTINRTFDLDSSGDAAKHMSMLRSDTNWTINQLHQASNMPNIVTNHNHMNQSQHQQQQQQQQTHQHVSFIPSFSQNSTQLLISPNKYVEHQPHNHHHQQQQQQQHMPNSNHGYFMLDAGSQQTVYHQPFGMSYHSDNSRLG